MWGVDSDALQSIISFFYSGECVLTFPSAIAIADAAGRLGVPNLAAAAHEYVREALSVNTAATILGHALRFKLSNLVTACQDLIADK